jgi:endonuclease I
LYFLLRYPGLVDPDELPAGRLEVLVNWYEQFPVGDYERHRNATTNGTATPPSSPQANATPLSTTPSEPAGLDLPPGRTLLANSHR